MTLKEALKHWGVFDSEYLIGEPRGGHVEVEDIKLSDALESKSSEFKKGFAKRLLEMYAPAYAGLDLDEAYKKVIVNLEADAHMALKNLEGLRVLYEKLVRCEDD